jgi:hypothetical protein
MPIQEAEVVLPVPLNDEWDFDSVRFPCWLIGLEGQARRCCGATGGFDARSDNGEYLLRKPS